MITLTTNQKVSVTRTGMEITGDITFNEWKGLAGRIGQAAGSMAFVIGDWLVYGEKHFLQPSLPGLEDKQAKKRVSEENYTIALTETGMDRGTLKQFAYVARSVKPANRNTSLSWEHHKAVAKLPDDEQVRWLAIAEDDNGELVGTRRLRRSIEAGRLLDKDELHTPPVEHGIENHIPHINRLATWWDGRRRDHWLDSASQDAKEFLLNDLQPVLDIAAEIEASLAGVEGGD